ncbi:Gfo/Idh/MocA family oxidoreductase [Agathobaculum sp.]|uniref:Gfo/Idh/MocA family oxidoreductase n=1 Tax=Agathobaculum sp. TaxID=2048138 RepID=UPI002A80FE97|nr:Gfo/Idh/MocA family oxidoreductase [Agathobaculum sp.]MDY3618989.1 Gfo/Idh/MocA family oxidoreductase [Agathobaculum sp.]
MKKLKIGTAGLGRLGYEHACNMAREVTNVELRAICDVDETLLGKVSEELGVSKTYTNFESMCRDPELDAVAVITPSALHAEQISAAMRYGKHVFCEKPLGTTVEQCKEAEKTVEAHPELIFQLGFNRRFDKNYVEAKRRIDAGEIGKIILVRSYTHDCVSMIAQALKFAPHSGSNFLDMTVHDIDLIRWFTGSEIKNLWGVGGVFEYDLYRELHDGDNIAALVQCESEAMGFMFAGRAAAQGFHFETEVIGTKGTLRIGSVSTDTQLEVLNEHGYCRPGYQDFVSRWHESYVAEMIGFADCVLRNRKPEITVYDGTAVSEAAYRCLESFRKGQMLPLR